jgi:hypothetical protein
MGVGRGMNPMNPITLPVNCSTIKKIGGITEDILTGLMILWGIVTAGAVIFEPAYITYIFSAKNPNGILGFLWFFWTLVGICVFVLMCIVYIKSRNKIVIDRQN